MTILTKLTIEELILLSLLYRHKNGVNPTFEDVRFDLSISLPGVDPDLIAESLEEKSFVKKEGNDYTISRRGKSAIMMRTNFVFEMLVNDLSRKPGLLIKLRNLINDHLHASKPERSKEEVGREESIPTDSDITPVTSEQGQ